jgi:hypothetical protein
MQIRTSMTVAIVVAMMGTGAFAQEEEATPPVDAEITPSTPADTAPTTEEGEKAEATKYDSEVKKENEGASRGESELARSRRIAGVGLHYGLIAGVVPGMGFDGYWQAFPSLQVGLLYNSGKLDLSSALGDSGDVKIEKASLAVTLTAVHARWFPGNSFYLDLGVGQRQVAAEFAMKSEAIDYGLEGKLEANSTIVLLAIGNQWQWDSGVTFGVEWLGYASAMGAKTSGELEETGAAAGSAPEETKEDLDKLKRDSEDAADALGKMGTPRAFVFGLGYAF